MIAPLLDELSTLAGERYVAFLLGLRGVLAAGLSASARDMRPFSDIRSGAYRLADVFLANEEDRFQGDLQIAQERARELALTDVLGDSASTAPSALEDFQDEFVTWFRQEVRAQIERDVNVLVSKRRALVIEASLKSRATGQDVDNVYAELIAGGRQSVDFYFTDRSGRRYPSQKFVRQLYRQGLLTFAIDSYALEAVALGVQDVVVETPDPSNAFNGRVLALGDHRSAPSLAEQRDEIFHPNSNSFIRAYS